MKKLLSILLITASFAAEIPLVNAASQQSSQKGQNLIARSEQLDTGSWTSTNVTRSANTTDTTDPFGENTAEKITASAGAGYHYLAQSATGLTNIPRVMTSSMYVKAGTARYAVVGTSIHTAWYRTWFDFNTNTISSSDPGVTGKAISVGNGWYRVSATFTVPVGTANPTLDDSAVGLSDGDGVLSYVAAGTETVYAWGAQLGQGNRAGPYNRTVASAINSSFVPVGAEQSSHKGQNLLLHSEELDNSGTWTLIGAPTITADTSLGPDGKFTADTLNDTNAGAFLGVTQSVSVPADTRTYIVSIFVKKTVGASIVAGLNVNLTGGTLVATSPRVDTNTGAKSSQPNFTVYDVGGYWRLSQVLTNNGTNSTLTFQIFPATGPAVGTDSVTATGSNVFTNAQIAVGNRPVAYNRTIASALNTSFTPAGVRQSSQKGQNLVLYSEQFDNAAWTKSAGVTVTANTQDVQGPYSDYTADKIVYDGSGVAGAARIFDAGSTPSTGAQDTVSVWLRTLSGTAQVRLWDGGATQAGPLTITTTWQRFSFTTMSWPGGTAQLLIYSPLATNTAFTIYAWGAQRETNSYAHAYNRTVASTINP